MRAEHNQILNDIRDNPSKKVDDAMRQRIDAALRAFDQSFDGKLSRADAID